MNATNTLGNMPSTPTNTKPLWATIGVLGVSVLAMGASLVSIYQRPAEPVALVAKPSANALASPAAVITEMADGTPVPKAIPAQQNTAQAATKNVVKTSPAKAAAPTAVHAGTTAHASAAPAPQAATPVAVAQAPVLAPVPAAAPVCANCGTVEAVTPVTRQGKGSGAGAVAGGVVGAVLGHQVGGGDGRTVATILGAVGGGLAGNAIEKNTKKTTVYAVSVRMDDGSTRSFEEASAPAVGAKVKVEGAALRAADGTLHAPLPAPSPRAAPQPQANVYNGR
jgi:outer membrane lipoprotein SlyB